MVFPSLTPRIRDWAGASVIVAVLLLAIVRSATAQSPHREAGLDDDAKRAVFRQVASREPSQRAASARKFPGDAWSQDDDFHGSVMHAARATARSRGVSLGEVLRVLDDGMREGWDGALWMRTTVPPCRPRPVY